jgi:hypothetical protein
MADIAVDPYTWSSTAANNSPSGSTAVGTGLDDNLRALQAGVKAALEALSSVAGTNTITGSCAGLTAYATGQKFHFVPANTNTGATTLNVTSLGAKNVFWNGAACVGGEIRQNIPCEVEYDGTQFHIVSNGFNAPFSDAHAVVVGSADASKKVRFEADGLTTATTRVITVPDRDLTLSDGPTLGTEQASTSGTSIDFTSIPSWAKQIEINLVGVSTNSTSPLALQLGDSGGIEAAGYSGRAAAVSTGSTNGATTHFLLNDASVAANAIHGRVTLSLEDSSENTWVMTSNLAYAGGEVFIAAGSKATSAALDRVRLTSQGGADTFDAGAVNILYR